MCGGYGDHVQQDQGDVQLANHSVVLNTNDTQTLAHIHKVQLILVSPIACGNAGMTIVKHS